MDFRYCIGVDKSILSLPRVAMVMFPHRYFYRQVLGVGTPWLVLNANLEGDRVTAILIDAKSRCRSEGLP